MHVPPLSLGLHRRNVNKIGRNHSGAPRDLGLPGESRVPVNRARERTRDRERARSCSSSRCALPASSSAPTSGVHTESGESRHRHYHHQLRPPAAPLGERSKSPRLPPAHVYFPLAAPRSPLLHPRCGEFFLSPFFLFFYAFGFISLCLSLLSPVGASRAARRGRERLPEIRTSTRVCRAEGPWGRGGCARADTTGRCAFASLPGGGYGASA